MAAIGALESGEKGPSIQLLRRMARQTDAARTRAELVDIENEDTKARYSSKKGPRGSRQKVAKARVVDITFNKEGNGVSREGEAGGGKCESEGWKSQNKGTK